MGLFGSKKETVVLSVEGMMCMHCAAKVEKGLKAVKGVKEVEVDLQSKTVTVTAANCEPQMLADAVNSLGFSATVK